MSALTWPGYTGKLVEELAATPKRYASDVAARDAAGAIAGAQEASALVVRQQPATDRKAVATMQARVWLAEFELERTDAVSLVAARWTMTRSLADVTTVEAVLRKVCA